MPNIKSAEKRMRQNLKRRLMNRGYLSQMRTEIKKFRRLLAESKLEDAQKALPQVYEIIDRSAQKGVIHANAAARYKSRLTKRLNEAAVS
ncbi:MAG: 30S ribosomal protein S20 [Acidobacteriota bacterium]